MLRPESSDRGGASGWSILTAVANEAVVELNDDIASRWGPRIVELLEVAAEAVKALAAEG